MSGNRYNMQSRYNKSNTSSLPFSSSGPSAINLYTNKTPSMKSNATSGYSSETSNSYSTEYNKANDHYSSPSSALTSLPGYISDFGSSHLSKGSYHQTNTYGSSPGVKNYSYPFSSPATSRNLSTNCSRIPSVTSSYSSGYIRSNSREDVKLQLPPKSPSTPRYISYTRSSRTSNTNYSSNTSSLNNNNSVNDSKTNKTNQNIEETKTKNKAPADFTSDSEDENTDIETKIISHTNTISISRSTSPKRETQTDSTNDSISSTQQIIRQKKRVFGVSIKKTTQETQVNEMDLKEGLSPSLSPSLSPCVTPSPSHSPSPVRMRYGCTPNKRNNNSSNFNRYSMPTIRSTTYSTNYSNFSSNTNISQSNQIENRISPQPLSSCDKQSDIKETSINNMSSDNQNANKDKKVEELCNNYNSAKNDEYDGYSNTNSPKSDSKSLQSIRDSHSSPRISPRIIRRRRSLSRNKLSGRSRSSSKEKLLDREESSTTSTSDSSEDEDDKKKSVADRHSRIKRKKKLQANELIFNDNKVIYKGSFDGINELKPTHLDSMPTRSVSAEPLKSFDENNQKKSSNESSSSPEKVIIRKPSVNIQKIEPLIVVTKLPLKIKDPYSTASECDESEFISESEAEKFSSSTPVVTIILSQSPTQNQSKQSDESSSETTDESTKICDNLNKSETKIQKSPTVIEVNLDNDTNSIQKSSTLTEVIAKSDESKEETDKYESSPDNETDDLSDFDDKSLHSFQEKQAFIAPFPKEDDEIPFKQLNSKDTSLRDSGFSEASTRPDSPYDNIKTPTNSPNIVSYENIYETDNCCAKEIIPAPQQFISKVNDIDSLLSGYKEETFEEFERKFQTESKHPVKYLKDDARKNLSLFISKCQDIDEMIGPTSPISPNLLSNFSSTSLSKLIEEIGEDDDSVAIDASAVKVHNAKAMKSTVEAYTEEIDSSAVRIRENKALSVHLSKMTEEIDQNYVRSQQVLNGKEITNFKTKKLDDCALQLYKYGSDNNECDYANYLDLEATIDEQSEEFEGFTLNRKNAVILRTQLSVRVHAIIEKLLNSSGRDLRRALFSLKQIFQDDKDLVHEFVQNDGLACLIKVGSEADQNYQNYILRALGQVMLYVDGMNGVIEHNETIQWLYTLISSQYRLVVKTALKLLLVFVEYADSNCLLLVNSIETVDSERGVKPWTNVMNIMNEKDSADIELLIFSMTLINKTLNGIPDQDTYYDISDAIEEQGMERIVQHYMSKQGTDHDLLQQFRTYEAVLRHEDGDDDGRGLPAESQRIVPRSRKHGSGPDEDRRKSRRHSFGTLQSVGGGGVKQQFLNKTNKCDETLPSWQKKVLQQTEQFNKKIFNSNNVNSNIVTSAFDDITPSLRKRRERDARQKSLIKEQEINNQRSSISSCSSADSYGSYASYGSYGSNEEKPSLIETIKILPPSMVERATTKFERNVEDENIKNNKLSFQKNTTNKWETNNNNNINNNINNNNNNINSNNNNNSNHFNNLNNFRNENSNILKTSDQMPPTPTGHYVLTKQTSVSDKKAWMLSMMYGKNNEDSSHLVNCKSPIPPTNSWNSNTNSETNDNNIKQSDSVRLIKERIMKPTVNTPDPIINGSIQRIISAKESLSDPKSQPEYLQWEQLVNSLSRPLLINDLDFTDLRDDDDADICAPTPTNSHSNTPPPLPTDFNLMPPPPPPPMCGTPPPPPPPLSGTPPPPPPPRMGVALPWALNQRNQNTPSPTPSPDLSKLIPKNKKTIKLFWKDVKEDKSLLSRIMKKKTIWDEIKNVSVDTQKLEHLFESRAKELMNKKAQEQGKKNEILVLDTKRSNAINIGMTKLPPPRTVKTAILKMDATIMNREGIEKILSTMMPTDEEKTKILEAQMANPDVPLGSAESFLLTLASISALEARLRLWAFRIDYDTIEREVAEPLMDLKQATAELEKCETFRLILGTLLSIGNFLNGVEAKGFQIDYLAKVPEVKDTVHKHSLLHHLCHIVMEKFPKSSDLYSELGAVSRASKTDFEEVAKSLQKMELDCKASWEHLKVIAKHDGSTPMKVRMSEFLADCAERIIVLGIIHRRVINRFKKFLVYLGLPSHSIKETKPNIILKTISEFALEYRTTRERVKEQLEKKANHRERNKTRGKMITEMDKFKTKEQQADHELKQLLINGSDYESEGCGGRVTKWGTLPGTKLRRPSSGSMTNLTNLNGTQSRPPAHHRHSVNIETFTEADDEILESLVRTSTQPMRNEQRNRQRSQRYGDRKSLRRTLKSGLDLSEEERLMLATMST